MEVDYSDRAVSLRIRQASQLRKLCLSLAKAGQALRRKDGSEDAAAPAGEDAGAPPDDGCAAAGGDAAE